LEIIKRIKSKKINKEKTNLKLNPVILGEERRKSIAIFILLCCCDRKKIVLIKYLTSSKSLICLNSIKYIFIWKKGKLNFFSVSSIFCDAFFSEMK